MADHYRGRPLGERVTELETSVPEAIRRLEEQNKKIDRLTNAVEALTIAMERRSASMRVVGWLGDLAKMVIAATAGGAGVHFLTQRGAP